MKELIDNLDRRMNHLYSILASLSLLVVILFVAVILLVVDVHKLEQRRSGEVGAPANAPAPREN